MDQHHFEWGITWSKSLPSNQELLGSKTLVIRTVNSVGVGAITVALQLSTVAA